MPRTCTVCTHHERDAIDAALVAGESYRSIAQRFAASVHAIGRHRADHIPELLARAQAAREAHGTALGAQVAQQEAAKDAHALDVMGQVERLFARMGLLSDACHDWLLDPDDPTRYFLGPRTEDVMVTYMGRDWEGKPVRKKAPLSQLLAKLEDAGVVVDRHETKYADPRELAIKVAAQLKGQTELLAKLLGDLQQEGTVNLTVSPEWATVRSALLVALAPYPEARVAVSDRLVALEGGAPSARAS
jgi:hypothetical protein